MKYIVFGIGLLINSLFSVSISGQTKNWKNHKMTSSDVMQMGAEYKMLSIDMAIAKFINDMEYLPKLFPLLIKGNESAVAVASSQLFNLSISDTSLQNITNELQKKIKLHQYFTSLRDDTLAVEFTISQRQISKLFQINQIEFVNAYIDDVAFSNFQNRDSNTRIIASSSLLDSIDVVVDIDMVSQIDTIPWTSDATSFAIGGDTLHVTDETSNHIMFECTSHLFDRIIDYQAYDKSGVLINPDSIRISSPIVEFNYNNTMALLNEFAILRDSIVEDITQYNTEATFNSALDSLLSNFQLKEVEDKYICKLYYPKPIDKILFYFANKTEQQKLKFTIPFRRDID